MGDGVFFNYSPEMTNAFEEEIRTEKISQLEMFYRGKFGHDPDPVYWSFDALSSNPVSTNACGPSTATIRRQGNTGGATYPVGSGRFPRDAGGTTRLGRSDRPLRPRSPPFRYISIDGTRFYSTTGQIYLTGNKLRVHFYARPGPSREGHTFH